MSKAQTQTVAATAEASKAKAPKVAFVFAQVTPDVAKSAAVATAKAVVTCEKAKRTLLASVASAVAAISVPLTAAQYDRQFRPYLSEAFAAQVKRNAISKATADQYTSKLKTAVLAILSKAATPQAGETFWDFYDRAAAALPSATFTVGEGENVQTVKVWEASSKKGRKAGTKNPAKPGGATPSAVTQANASAANAGEGGFNRSPKVAAALILTGNNEARAQRLVLVMSNYVAEFDKWAATILSDQDKEAVKRRTAEAPTEPAEKPEPVTLKTGEPATAMAAALVKAESQRQRKTASK